MEADLEHMRGQKEQECTVQREVELRPWRQDTWEIEHRPQRPNAAESRSTTPTVHGDVPQDPSLERAKAISGVFCAIGVAEQQDTVSDESCDKVPRNPRLGNSENGPSPGDVVGTGNAFSPEQYQSGEASEPSIGWAQVTVVTDSSAEGDSDPYPSLEVAVHFDSETRVGFPCKPDTGADLNVITDEILVDHLGFSTKALAPSDLEDELRGASDKPIKVLGWVKITFFVNGKQDPIRAKFYVIPSSYLPCGDGLLSGALVKKHHLLELSKTVGKRPRAASCASTGQLTETALRQLRV